MKKIVYGIIALAICLSLVVFYVNRQPSKPKCLSEVTAFDKRSGDINALVKEIESGAIHYRCDVYKSKYMHSRVETYTDSELLKKASEEVFGKEEDTKNSNVEIRCELYENDKEDPGKKSSSCKLFAGYLLYTFTLDGEQIYKIQIDVEKSDFSDIPLRLNCIKNSLYYYAKK